MVSKMSYLITLLHFLICISVACNTMVEPLFLIKKSKVEFPVRIPTSLPALSSSVLIHPSFLLILHSSLVALIYKVTGISSIPVIFKYAHFPGTPLWSPSLHPNFFLKAAQNQMLKTRIISPRILDLICIYSFLLRESLLSPTSGQKIESPSLPFPP